MLAQKRREKDVFLGGVPQINCNLFVLNWKRKRKGPYAIHTLRLRA